MRPDAQQLHDQFMLYHLHAEFATGADRSVAMLGMMACLAAIRAKLTNMPAEWGWPRAVCPQTQGLT